MNVLVTGIDGFVGRHLAEALLNDTGDTGDTGDSGNPGITLFGARHNGAASKRPQPDNGAIRYITADVTNPDEVTRAVAEAAPEKIFHIAGQAFVPTSFENPSETFQINFQGTLNILEAVRRTSTAAGRKCSVLIVSSGEVYGSVPEDRLPIDETFPLHPENPYAVSKACADMIAQQYRSSFGVEAVVARPFNHIGPGQSDLFVGSAFARQVAEIAQGMRAPKLHVGNLDARRDFTDVRDVVNAYIKLLGTKHSFSVVNICSGRAVAIRTVLETLCELAGVKVDVVIDPAKIRANDTPVVIGNAGRLQEATGWKPEIPLRQTLGDLLAYWTARLAQPA